MRRQELLILIGVSVFISIIFLSFILLNLFSSSTQPTQSPNPSSRPGQSFRPFDSSANPSSRPASPPPLPTVLPSKSPGEPTKQSLINQMPVQTDFADIEYLSSGDTFVVTIKKNPYLESQNKVRQWFDEQGFNPDALKIYWQTYPEVVKE